MCRAQSDPSFRAWSGSIHHNLLDYALLLLGLLLKTPRDPFSVLPASLRNNCRSSASSLKRYSSSRVPAFPHSCPHTRSPVECMRVSAPSAQKTCVCVLAQWTHSLCTCLVHRRLLLGAMTHDPHESFSQNTKFPAIARSG